MDCEDSSDELGEGEGWGVRGELNRGKKIEKMDNFSIPTILGGN